MEIYLEDSYQKECDAKVMSVKDGKFVVLDKNLFYPKGGGQPHDEGKLIRSDGKEFSVVFVGKFDGKISHQVEPENELKEGDEVHCMLDWDRRYKLMRMHTAAHVISGVLHKEAGAMITGNQLDIEKTRIDFSMENFDKEKMQEYIDHANEAIQRDHKIEIYSMPREEALEDPEISKLAKGLPDLKEFRIVDIVDFDRQADGGTHVHSLKEVGKLSLLKCENKGKSNRRMYFSI